MNTFAVYANVFLTRTPDWFDEVWRAFRGDRTPYVTLKPTCFIAEEEVPAAEQAVQEFLHKKRQPVPVRFEHIRAEPDWPIMMLDADPNEELSRLQHELSGTLSRWRNYVDKDSEEHEKSFRPHLTFAIGLTPQGYEAVQGSTGEDTVCVGVIRELVLEVNGNPRHNFLL